jgi:hypothetical protein
MTTPSWGGMPSRLTLGGLLLFLQTLKAALWYRGNILLAYDH